MRRPWCLSIATQSLASLRRRGQGVHLVFGGDCRPATVASTTSAPWCCLTFELRGRCREGAWPARRMMTLAGARAKWLAGGGPLERRVRHHNSLPQGIHLHALNDDHLLRCWQLDLSRNYLPEVVS